MPGSNDLLTAAQVAERFQVTPATVVRWAKEGRLTCVRITPRTLRFRPEDLEALLKEEVA